MSSQPLFKVPDLCLSISPSIWEEPQTQLSKMEFVFTFNRHSPHISHLCKGHHHALRPLVGSLEASEPFLLSDLAFILSTLPVQWSLNWLAFLLSHSLLPYSDFHCLSSSPLPVSLLVSAMIWMFVAPSTTKSYIEILMPSMMVLEGLGLGSN